jgi:hypothetical protein
MADVAAFAYTDAHSSVQRAFRACARFQCTLLAKHVPMSAGKFLKADKMSYAAKKEEYDPFFAAVSGIGKWKLYYEESEEEKARQARENTLLFAGALALMATPIGFIGVLAVR